MVPSAILNSHNNSNQNIPIDIKCPFLFLSIHSKSSSFFKAWFKPALLCSLIASHRLILPPPGQRSHLDYCCRFQLLFPQLSPPSNPLVTSPASRPSWAPVPPHTQGLKQTIKGSTVKSTKHHIWSWCPTNLMLTLVTWLDHSQPQCPHLKTRIKFPIPSAHETHFPGLTVAMSFNKHWLLQFPSLLQLLLSGTSHTNSAFKTLQTPSMQNPP